MLISGASRPGPTRRRGRTGLQVRPLTPAHPTRGRFPACHCCTVTAVAAAVCFDGSDFGWSSPVPPVAREALEPVGGGVEGQLGREEEGEEEVEPRHRAVLRRAGHVDLGLGDARREVLHAST